MKKLSLFSVFALFLIFGCKVYEAKPFDFPIKVNTKDRPIQFQEKKIYSIESESVFADNRFDGARLNDFKHIKDNLFQVTIEPENMPINPSPYYAFKIWSKEKRQIDLEINYTDSRHRYEPKISFDRNNWELLDSNLVTLAEDSVNVMLNLEIGPDTIWIAAQEIQNSTHVRNWCQKTAEHPDARFSTIGKSKLGRDLLFLDIGSGDLEKKEIVAIISRQHPPEVTGYLAMKAFIEEIMEDHPLANNFRKKYRVMVFPLMNPDGVDLGHWRHNAGGIDLNRDWAFYHQPENRNVANFIVKTASENKSKVILGLDFHSTYYDIFYTNKTVSATLPHFKDYWLKGIENALGKETRESESYLNTPVSKNWFLTQFGAEGIVYEIGDTTPRDFIKEKGKQSAVEMMELLIYR